MVDRLPARGPALAADLRAAADRLRGPASRPEASIALPALLSRALLLGALGRHDEARAAADRAVAIGPASSRARVGAPWSAAARGTAPAPWPTSRRGSPSTTTLACGSCAPAS